MDGIFYKNNILKWLIYKYNGLVQQRRNFIANALELRLSCTNPLNTSCLFSGKLININDTSMNHQQMICTMWWRSLPLMQHHGIQCDEDHVCQCITLEWYTQYDEDYWNVNASCFVNIQNVMRLLECQCITLGWSTQYDEDIWYVNASPWDDIHNVIRITGAPIHHTGMICTMWWGILVC